MTSQQKVDNIQRLIELKEDDLRKSREALKRNAQELRELDNQLVEAAQDLARSLEAQAAETKPREWHGCIDPRGHYFTEGVCQTVGCEFDIFDMSKARSNPGGIATRPAK